MRPSRMRSEHVKSAATIVMALCALIVTAFVVRRELRPSARSEARSPVRVEEDWAEYATSGHSLGPPGAPVTIVEFSDFQCSFCRGFAFFHDSLTSLGFPVRVIYRHYPLPIHRHAVAAVRASECAEVQGHFKSMHAALFARQDSIGVAPWWRYARTAGVRDSASFQACMESNGPIAALARDTIAGKRLNVRGTPTLLIQELRVDGLPTFDSLLVYIQRAASKSARATDRT